MLIAKVIVSRTYVFTCLLQLEAVVAEVPLLDTLWKEEALKHLRAVGWPEQSEFCGLKTTDAVFASLASHLRPDAIPTRLTAREMLAGRENARDAQEGVISFKLVAAQPGNIKRRGPGAVFRPSDVAVTLHLIHAVHHESRKVWLDTTPVLHSAAGVTPEPCILSLQAVPWTNLQSMWTWQVSLPYSHCVSWVCWPN